MKKFILATFVVGATLGLASPVIAKDVLWTGCGISKKAFMEGIAAAYETATGHKVVLAGGGATKGIRAVAASTTEVGGTCRPVLQDPQGQVHPEEKDVEMIPVAWDALVATVHVSNPVNNITLENLKKIYTGEIDNWQALGWSGDNPIALVERDEKDSGVGYVFRRLAFNDPNINFQARSLKERSGPLDKRVEKVVTSLALDGASSAHKNKNIKMLSLDGVAPTKENIAAGKYFLFRPLFMVLHRDSPVEARDLVKFVLSPAGQKVISQQGVVSYDEGKALIPLWQERTVKYGF